MSRQTLTPLVFSAGCCGNTIIAVENVLWKIFVQAILKRASNGYGGRAGEVPVANEMEDVKTLLLEGFFNLVQRNITF